MPEMLDYLSGFGNENATEAIRGAFPSAKIPDKSPRLGFIPEQLSGTSFTVPGREARRVWLYRIRPFRDASRLSPH
jgi:homogentisate 1,2-dioxygenase